MKSALTVLITISFVAIAVFGIFAMNHGGDHGRGCIAATSQGDTDCPNQTSPFAFLTFHFDAFRSFSTAVLDAPFASTLLVVLALIFLSFFVFFSEDAASASSRLHAYRSARQESFAFPFRVQLTHWLALHENSPSAV